MVTRLFSFQRQLETEISDTAKKLSSVEQSIKELGAEVNQAGKG